MRFTSAIVAAVALASSALAQTAGFSVMTSPTQDQQLAAGSSFDLIWTPGTPTGPVTIVLLQGETAATLQVGATLATGVPSTLGKFTYTVPSTSAFKTYGFKITLDSNTNIFQYSFPFHISGATSSSSSASGSATTAATSTSSAVSSSVTGVTTSVAVPTSTANATVSTATKNSTSSVVIVSSTSVAVSTSSASGNSTTLLSSIASATKTATLTSAAGGSATSKPTLVPTNAAVAKVASAGIALGGMLMAFAL